IVKYPISVLTIMIVVILLFAVGAQQVELATGYNTLIEEDTEVYQINKTLEQEFGGESIIVLYEAANNSSLLTSEALNQIENLESQLSSQDGIYTIVGSHTAVENITKKNAEKYKEGLTEMADGMNGMGEKLQEISVNIKENATGQSLPDFESKISEMEKLIGRMVEGQKKLERGSGELLDGYSNMGSQLKDVAMKLQQSAIQMENNAEGPAGHKQAAKFKHFGVKLNA